ncbi:MAG: hypothetical protein RIT45_673 [Pseudomonadota bacterium]
MQNLIRTLRPAARIAALVALVAACSGEDAGKDGNNGAGCSNDADCAALEDGNACNGTLRCETTLGVCTVDPTTVPVCDQSADTACSTTACDPATGSCKAQAAATGTACSDGDPCTAGDPCEAGSCKAGVDSCDCRADADCSDDGNLCNGTPFCDKDHFPYRCVVNPATVVTCDASDVACKANLCDPKQGKCVLVPVADGATCDDGDNCTSGDTCKGGGCKGGTDTCSCTSDADCPDLDGDLCNGVRYCDIKEGVCKDNPASGAPRPRRRRARIRRSCGGSIRPAASSVGRRNTPAAWRTPRRASSASPRSATT